MSYRPVCDSWILCRPKVKYYGAFPAGFLHRARALLGVSWQGSILHVCSGKIKDYPYRGLGINDQTLDMDPACEPTFLMDARQPFPRRSLEAFPEAEPIMVPWDAILIDRPYSEEDADHYVPGRDALPSANLLVKNGIAAVGVGGKVGILDYVWPQPPRNATEVAVVAVYMGRNNRARQFTVFERLS